MIYRKSPAAATAAALALLAFAAATSIDARAQQPNRIVKSAEGEPLKVDESGLTQSFEGLRKMLRHVDAETIDGEAVEIHAGRLPTKGPDYEAFLAMESGILQFQTTAAIKLRTDAVLRFGEVEVVPGNVAPDYPGLYSLWLHRAPSGEWKLIFNHEADAWGTMYDPQRDLGEVALEHGVDDGAEASFSVDLDADAGVLTLGWGDHVWKTTFSVG